MSHSIVVIIKDKVSSFNPQIAPELLQWGKDLSFHYENTYIMNVN